MRNKKSKAAKREICPHAFKAAVRIVTNKLGLN